MEVETMLCACWVSNQIYLSSICVTNCSSSNFKNQDDTQANRKDCHHEIVLSKCSKTSKEGDEGDDNTKDDKKG